MVNVLKYLIDYLISLKIKIIDNRQGFFKNIFNFLKKFSRILNNPIIINKFNKFLINVDNVEYRLSINSLFKKKEFWAYKKEILESGIIRELKEKQEWFNKNIKGQSYRNKSYTFGSIDVGVAIIIYSLIRKLQPTILVETGVCNGFSTAFILLALHQNDKGMLYSIDFPEVEGEKYEEGTFWGGKGGAVIPKGKDAGWVIPKYLKKNFELILGKSQEKLPQLFKRLKKIDFFIHDSEHSYDCMWFEFNKAFQVLNEGGILISHDIGWNSAFYDFCKKYNKRMIKIAPETALIWK